MNVNFTSEQIKKARELLKLNQTDFAHALGWTSPRNIANLENQTHERKCTVQTALAIECLLRRAYLWDKFNF